MDLRKWEMRAEAISSYMFAFFFLNCKPNENCLTLKQIADACARASTNECIPLFSSIYHKQHMNINALMCYAV